MKSDANSKIISAIKIKSYFLTLSHVNEISLLTQHLALDGPDDEKGHLLFIFILINNENKQKTTRTRFRLLFLEIYLIYNDKLTPSYCLNVQNQILLLN